MTLVHPDSPLQVGDQIEMHSKLHGYLGLFKIMAALPGGVYKTNAYDRNGLRHIRRAKHRPAKENGQFVFVQKHATGRWGRCECGPAKEWACNPQRMPPD